MTLVKTARLKKHEDMYEIKIPQDLIDKLQWREGLILEINEEKDKLIIEKMHGFVGS